MIMTRWLWLLWGAMILSMVIKWQADTYMIVALIILPILIVLMDLHEEIAVLKEENRHQRKFVMDRYNLLQERLKEMSTHIEKRMVVDFAELAKNNTADGGKDSDRLAERLQQNETVPEQPEVMSFQDDSDDIDDDDDTYLDDEDDTLKDPDDFSDI